MAHLNIFRRPPVMLAMIVGIWLVGAVVFGLPSKLTAPSDNSWKTFTDAKQGISFQYPETLSAKYVYTQDWPPVVKIENRSAYPCPADSRQIDGKFSYCVQMQTEGAASSIYTTYTYSTGSLTPGKTVTIAFTLRLVQCGNYGDTQKTECEQERQTFSVDGLADRIAHSIVFQK